MMVRLLAFYVLVLPIGCATRPPWADGPVRRTSAADTASARPWDAPSVERTVSGRDGRTGAHLSLDEILAKVADADVVFLGEQHTDETTHQVELAVYDALLARRSGKVVLALEMFERDVQADLDAYLAGQIDEPAFLAKSRPWGNYATSYRLLIERAKAAQGLVIASNFPAPLRQRLAREGPEALQGLEGDAKHQGPAELHPETPEFWRRADNAVRSHRAMMAAMRAGGGADDDPQRLYDTQSLWDNAMGESCALALDQHPGCSVLHVNGGFHSEYWDGAVRQLNLRRPQTRVLTVAIVPATNPELAEVRGAPVADFVVFAAARATDIDEGAWSVYVSRTQKYRLHMPKSASSEHPVPLLIWLNDDGLTASDGIDLWKDRLGPEAAIAVIEPLYPEVEPDLSTGGRWFWPDSFSSDIGAAISAIEETWGYALRHFPIDPSRVCLAGEGTGATVVAATALLTDRLSIKALALGPRQYAKIKDFPLPLREPRDEPPPERTLTVAATPTARAWWQDELREYEQVQLPTELIPIVEDEWTREIAAENALRAKLGLAQRKWSDDAQHEYIYVETDSPKARHWARLFSIAHGQSEGTLIAVFTERVATDARDRSWHLDPEELARPGYLPKCPGPFGGTTILVHVAADPDAALAPRLKQLEENDPINKQSRFHRLRIATFERGRRLAEVLDKLHSEHRDNVLIVPDVFCADAATMREFKRSVREYEDVMTIQWLPGLGGRLSTTQKP